MPKFVKPSKAGNVVPHAERGFAPLAQEGEWVPDTPYWTRRLNAGDVIETDPPEVSEEEVKDLETPPANEAAAGGDAAAAPAAALKASRRRSINPEEK